MEEAVEYIDLVRKRTGIMEAIEDEPLELRTIQERTGASRSTVNRAVRSLEEAGFVQRSEGSYTLTATGRLALDHHRSYRRRWEDLVDAGDVLDALPRDASVDLDVVAGGEAAAPPEEAPYRPIQRLQAEIADADRYRGILPALPDPRGVRLLYEHVVTDGNPAELVVSGDLRSSLAEGFPRRLSAMVETGEFELLVGDVPPYGLVLTEADGETTVTLIAFGDAGTVSGVIRNDSGAAVRWAEERYAERREDARRVTDPVRETTDGGVTTLAGDAGSPPDPLDPALERQGFVRLNRSYFLEREVADPATAWRAGLDLAEVHTGYAAERTDDGTPLADRLIDSLADGEDRVLVGPPGSGKSTTAKRVACEWYEAGRGPVFYRESGRGSGFDAVDELVAGVEGAEGHPLVIVEDAVRPDAAAVFEAIDALAGRGDVSFLLDAREREWRDPPDDVAFDPGDPDLRVEHMPRLDEEDRERLVEQFERTVGVSVDRPAGRLREDTSPSIEDGEGAAPSEVLLLLHRLSFYADPLAEGPTDLDADVARNYEELRDRGEPALDVATAANALNAAGVPFGPAHLRAVTEGAGAGSGDDAFGRAIEALDGRVLFGLTGDGTYRTVHEAWSVEFLAALLDRTGEAGARERFGRVVSDLLALADDPGALDEREGGSDPRARERVARDPSGWADETVEAVFALGRDWPKLAPLLGDAEGTSVDLPDACASVTDADCTAWLGRAFLDRGEYDRAEAAFRRLSEDGEFALERLHGLGQVAIDRGEYATAEEHAERCLALARERDDRRGEARSLNLLGEAAWRRGDYDRARKRHQQSLEVVRELGDRRSEGNTLENIGVVARHAGEYGTAREYLKRALELRRELGDRQGEANSLGNLGNVAYAQDDYETAREHFQRTLELKRELGDRQGEMNALNNLGVITMNQGDYGAARECFERSLDLARTLGTRQGEANSLGNLGLIAHGQDDYGAAREHLQQALDIFRELGDRQGEAGQLDNLGLVAHERGDYEAAREYHRQALEIKRELGERRGEVKSLNNLGDVALRQGEHGTAREYQRQALDISREIGHRRGEAYARLGMGQVDRREGEYGPARRKSQEAREAFADIGFRKGEAAALRALGRIAHDRGDHETAREHMRAAVEAFEEIGAVRERIDALERLAEIESDAADPAAVREYCERALEAIDAADDTYDLADRRDDFEEWLADLDGRDAVGPDPGSQ